jgi:hypothetical protein
MESVLKMTKPINDYYGFDAWHGLGDRGGLTISKAIQLVRQAKGGRAEPAGPSAVL